MLKMGYKTLAAWKRALVLYLLPTSIKIYHLVFNTFCPFLLCVVFNLPCRKFRGAFLGTSYISKPRLGVGESGTESVSCSLDSGLCLNDSQTRINLNLNVVV